MNGKGRLNNKTKYSYMFGDLGCCLMNYMLINYFMFYCTNMLGISIAAVGMIMFIARIWDAINDIGALELSWIVPIPKWEKPDRGSNGLHCHALCHV